MMMFLASGTFAMAQANGGLKGPAAKNYKYWLDDNKPVATMVVTSDQEPLQGPAAKNKIWHKTREVDENKYVAVETVTARPRIIGPNAKHTRPYHFRNMRVVSDDSETGLDNFTTTKEPKEHLNK
jgi:hypothetical protein